MRDDEIIGVDERQLDDVALEALAEAHAARPPSRLRSQLLGTVKAEAAAAHARRTVVRWRAVGTIAATVALVLTGLLARERARTTGQMATIEMTKDNFGQTSLQELRSKLAEYGLKLKGD